MGLPCAAGAWSADACAGRRLAGRAVRGGAQGQGWQAEAQKAPVPPCKAPGRKARHRVHKGQGRRVYNAAFAGVDAIAPPWTPGNQHCGRSNMRPRALAKCVILVTGERKPCRDMESHLRAPASPQAAQVPGPQARALEEHIQQGGAPHSAAVPAQGQQRRPEGGPGAARRHKKKSDSVDGTGASTSRIEKWSAIRKDAGRHRAYQKLSARMNNGLMAAEDYAVAKGTAGDSPAGKMPLRRRDPGAGDSCMDAAYLSREVCDLVDGLGRDPYIWPKKNTIHNAKGCQAWASRDLAEKHVDKS